MFMSYVLNGTITVLETKGKSYYKDGNRLGKRKVSLITEPF